MGYLTLAPENQFSFKCPIFDTSTKMASCVKLRTMFWKGQRPPQRRGCQACMEAGLCPAAKVVQQMAMSGTRKLVADDYGSHEPVTGRLRRDLLESIRNTIVSPSVLSRHGLSQVEKSLIASAGERIATMIGTAPAGASKKATIRGNARQNKVLQNPETPKVEEKNEALMSAAKSGDLAAAL